MGCTPKVGQHVLVRPAAGRPILALDPAPERVGCARNEAVASLGQDDAVSAGLVPALAPPAWPPDRRGRRPVRLGRHPHEQPRPPLRGLAAHQAPAGRRTAAPGRQRLPALDPQPRLQPRAQHSQDERDHRPRDRGALDGAPPGARPLREDRPPLTPFASLRISG
jgi:hypothetical protein